LNKELYDWLDKIENYKYGNNKSSYKTIKQLRKENQELYSKSVKFLKSKVNK
tara:strand:- start:385 stop:540 length:156 start_codon:yes stop_codon:yes gene_type:complete